MLEAYPILRRSFLRAVSSRMTGGQSLALGRRLVNLGMFFLGVGNFDPNMTLTGERYLLRALLGARAEIRGLLDVGAFKGQFSRIALGYQPNLSVVLVEPQSDLARDLESTLGRSRWVEVLKAAVGPHRGIGICQGQGEKATVAYTTHADTCGQAVDDFSTQPRPKFTHTLVNIVTLDDALKELERVEAQRQYQTRGPSTEIEARSPWVPVKIDTEGLDLDILSTAVRSDLFRRLVCAVTFEIGGTSPHELHDFTDVIAAFGPAFSIYRLSPAGLLPLDRLQQHEYRLDTYQNWVALRKAVFQRSSLDTDVP